MNFVPSIIDIIIITADERGLFEVGTYIGIIYNIYGVLGILHRTKPYVYHYIPIHVECVHGDAAW